MKRTTFSACALLVSLFPASFAAGEAVSGQTTLRRSFPEAFGQGLTLPRWSGNLMFTWRTETVASDTRDNIIIYGENSTPLRKYRLWFPDAAIVRIWDAAGYNGDQVALVGQAVNTSGVFAAWIAVLSAKGSAVRVVQTMPFEGKRVTWATDGSLWVLGFRLTTEQRRLLTSPPHAVLHHYDRNGSLLGQHLQWPEIACGRHPLLGGAMAVTASKDTVGVFFPECNTWLELTMTGEIKSRWQVRAKPGYDVSKPTFFTVAMTSSDRVYCLTSVPGSRLPDGSRAYNALFVLNREEKLWEPAYALK